MSGSSGDLRTSILGFYENDMDCAWTVSTPGNSLVHLHFESFDLENSTDCVFDYLELEAWSGVNLAGWVVIQSDVSACYIPILTLIFNWLNIL